MPANVARVHARVVPAEAGDTLLREADLALVGFVDVTRPTTAISRGAGSYADPLPPLGPHGQPAVRGRWNGVLVTFTVPDAAPPGRTPAGSCSPTGAATTPRCRSRCASPASRRSPGMTRRPSRSPIPVQVGPYVEFGAVQTDDERIQRMVNLVGFMAEHHVTPWDYPFAAPSDRGTYQRIEDTDLWTRAAGTFLDRYLKAPFAADTAATVLPHRTLERTMASMSADAREAYLAGLARSWAASGWPVAGSMFHVWDEPSPAREQNEIPALNTAIHAALPGAVTYGTTFPVVPRPARRLCKWFGDRACRTFRGVTYTNQNLWDGGPDDLDAWVIATRRYYGRFTTPLEAHYGYDNGRERYALIQQLRARGKQVWSYHYFNYDRRLPDLAIDGPPTDPSVLMAFNAYEANAGWFHWAFARWTPPAGGGSRNPYDDPLSWTIGRARSNGEASLVYPAVSQRYGLTDAAAQPVSSLRMEQIADGAELVNLAAQARAVRGDAFVRRTFRPVFNGRLRVTDTGATWLDYDNAGLALRLEKVRRALLQGVEAAPTGRAPASR